MNYDLNFNETGADTGIFEGTLILTDDPEDLPGITLIEDTETGASFYLRNEITTGDLLLSVILLLFLLFSIFKLVISRRIPHLTRYWK